MFRPTQISKPLTLQFSMLKNHEKTMKSQPQTVFSQPMVAHVRRRVALASPPNFWCRADSSSNGKAPPAAERKGFCPKPPNRQIPEIPEIPVAE